MPVPQSLTNPKNVAVGVAEVHFADVPGHVGWGIGHFDLVGEAVLMDSVDVINPDRHPNPFISCLASLLAEGGLVRPFAATSLSSQTEENLEVAVTNAAERGGMAPLKPLLPTEPCEPIEALPHIRNIQDRRHMSDLHRVTS